MNLNKEFEKYVEDLYNINPDDLEGEYIKVVKSFYIFSRLTSEAYADSLTAKEELKKISSQVFLDAKSEGSTDNKCKEVVNISPNVIKAKKAYIDKVRKWELYKSNRDTVVMKKDMLKSIGFNRKVDSEVTDNS
jgi:hypothetical protein|tara:strand:- start:897 stop:1298 length:402 start_codon:yes stop_codon:yes gene_type:complete